MYKILIFLFLVCSHPAIGQTISGMVTNTSGDPLFGATVAIEGGKKGTTTDSTGAFTLDITPPVALIFSYVGYTTRRMELNTEATIINVVLIEGMNLESITVVGTRGRPRTSMNASVPVDNIDISTLEESGKGVLDQQLMFKVPSYNSTQQPISDAAAYFNPAGLRGLYSSRTLVLVNGKRKNASALVYSYVTPGRGEVGVDMKSIPSAALERVEILRDGAAAQYGSDAVAGVINLVLKKHTEPFVNTGFSTTSRGDGAQYQLESGFGSQFNDNGYINFTLSYFNQNKSQRAGTITSLEDEATFWGVTEDTPFDRTDLAELLAREPSAGFLVGLPDQSITNFTYNTGYVLDKKTDTEVYSFGTLTNRSGSSPQFARVEYWVPGFKAIYPDADYFRARMSPQIGDHSLSLGLRSKWNDWDLDLSTTFGYNRIDYYIKHSFNQSYAGGSPTDFYNGAHQFSHTVNNLDIVKSFIYKTGLTLTTAFGVEHRTERFEAEAGEFASYGDGMSPDAQGTRIGSESFPGIRPENASIDFRDNIGIYADVTTDIGQSLLLGGALRYENYSDFGGNISWKLNGRYRFPDKRLNLRFSVSNGFRAPALHQIYYSALITILSGGGLRQTGFFANDNPALRAIGIPELQPETSLNFGAGLTFRLFDHVGLTADVYQINLKDRIVLSGQVTPTGDPNAAIDQVLSRVGAGAMNFFLNAIDTRTRGLDVVVNMHHIKMGKGEFSGNIAANFNRTSIEGGIKTSDFIEQIGQVDNIFGREDISRVESWRPRTKIIATGNYEIDRFRPSLSLLYYGGVTHRTNDPVDDAHYRGKLLTDISTSFTLNDQLTISIGINNLFDVFPDTFAYAYKDRGGYPQDRNLDFVGRFKYPWQPTQFGIDGRRYFTRLVMQF